MATPAARILFPSRSLTPLKALSLRVGAAAALLLLVALITFWGGAGYRDVDGSPITFLDAIYYASVSVTTTGYGDITPVSSAARLWTALVVTPARILFLIVLVGTTIEVLTERFRENLAISRWRKRVNRHVIVVGYGTLGRSAVKTLLDHHDVSREQIVIVDRDDAALEEARRHGLVALAGDATRTSVLHEAQIAEAKIVIITCNRDDTATLVSLTARELNPGATIVASVHEAENAHLLRQSGANTVIVTSEATGRMLALSTHQPAVVSVLDDLLIAGQGLELDQRPVSDGEIGGPPQLLDGCLPVAIWRDGARIPFDDRRFLTTQSGDMIVGIHSEAR